MIQWLCCDPFNPIKLEKKYFIIGRGEDTDLHLNDKYISRHHAAIAVQGDPYRVSIADLGSSNGTQVNGRRITKAVLKSGDEITIGHYKIIASETPTKLSESKEFFTASREFAMVGQLDKSSLAELFQSIEFNEKSGTLFISHKQYGEGELGFVKGKPYYANFNKVYGEAAILIMLQLTAGMFMLSEDVASGPRTITSNFTNILLDHYRQLDELKSATSKSDETRYVERPTLKNSDSDTDW